MIDCLIPGRYSDGEIHTRWECLYRSKENINLEMALLFDSKWNKFRSCFIAMKNIILLTFQVEWTFKDKYTN